VVLFYIKLSGWLDLEILGPGIKNCSYTNLSGAERISLDRSFQMASVDIKKGQSSALIDVLILDEYLDSSLDDIGMVDAIELIKSNQEKDKLKVLVVSHRKELGSLDSMFDHKYEVSMDKYSTIKEIV
jgi:DNA repair exonuclease SbcCD ATPase subunit